MTIGFKTGPRTWEESKVIVEEDGATMCEIWFDVRKAAEYQPMFDWLAARKVKIGLHYWGLIDDKIKPNLCASNAHIRAATIDQMMQTITIAHEIKAVYVNIHPGAQALEEMNFDRRTQELVPGEKVGEAKAWQALSESAKQLQDYAQQRDVLLTIETLPGREAEKYEARESLYDPGNASLDWLLKLGQQGNFIANDITHTSSTLAIVNNDPVVMWQGLMDFSRQAAAQTRLVHLNTMIPPFNGTDSHNGLLEEDWAGDAWPNLDQIREFLTLFKNRDDVFIVPEPRLNMRENYQQLTKLAAANAI